MAAEGLFELVANHRGYRIDRRRPGFEFTPMLLGKVSAYIAYRPGERPTIFAFMYRFPEVLPPPRPSFDEGKLAAAAVRTIQELIDQGFAIDGTERTFELRGGEWVEVAEARWWIGVHDRGTQG